MPAPTWLRPTARVLLAVFFIAAGANHFLNPEIYRGMMPPWLPVPPSIHLVAGAAEMLGGLGLLVPATRRWAAWGLIALLIAVFPANVHVALSGAMTGTDLPAWVLWARLPLQAGFIAAVAWTSPLRRA
jgi:uncharacterized membrane protein